MPNGSQDNYQTSTYQPPPPASTPPAQPPAPVPQPIAPPDTREAPRRALHGQRKSPFIACMLSLMPGIGQVYVGYYKLGFVHNVVFAGTIMILSLDIEALVPLFAIFLAFFYVYNVVDAGRRAAFYNMALDGVEGIELPEEMNVELPSFGGSMGGGLFLMVLGAILLSNTVLGVSLEWVEDWWPVAPIVLGGYLFVRALQERRQAQDDDDLGAP